MIDPGLLRAIHQGLLVRLGITDTYEFWRAHPYELDGVALDPIAIARLLGGEQHRISMRWAARVMNGLEPFLNTRGHTFQDFAELLLPRVNQGSFISAQSILATMVPFLVRLSRLNDPHRVMIRMFTFATARMVPGLVFDEVAALPGADVTGSSEAVLLIGMPALWDGAIDPFDGEIFIADLFCKMPRSLGLLPFEEVSVIADVRPAAQIAHDSELALRDDVVLLDGVPSGVVQPFSTFCQERRLRLQSHGQPDSLVVVMQRDWQCPRRKRTVLRAGCAYGAPVYLLRARWAPQRERIHHVFDHLVSDALKNDPAHEAHELAARFIASYERVIACVFDPDDNAFYVGDRLICRGVPALILRNTVRGRLAERNEFTFREFKRDREIVPHPKNTGFEVRLARLRNALDEAHCGLRIEAAGRGRFRLISDGRLELQERPYARPTESRDLWSS